MDDMTRKCIVLIAKVVVRYIMYGNVVPNDLWKLSGIAEGKIEEVE